MKTNYFILNFISTGRLVYFANAPKSGEPLQKIAGSEEAKKKIAGSEKKKDAPEAAKKATKDATEKGKKAAKKAEQQRLELNDKDYAFYNTCKEKAGKIGKEGNKERLEELVNEIKKMKTDDKTAKSFILAKIGQIYTKNLLSEPKTEIKQELLPTKEEVAKIFEGKKDNLQKLLEYFTKEGYRKGKRDWVKYNTEVLNILDKKGANNKKEWIIAFQEWAGAGKDGAVGPNTMLALARKIGEEKIGRKIKRTMIAKRSKKKRQDVRPGKGVEVPKTMTPEELGEVAIGGVYYNPMTNEYASFASADELPEGEKWRKATEEQVATVLSKKKEKETAIASASETEEPEYDEGIYSEEEHDEWEMS